MPTNITRFCVNWTTVSPDELLKMVRVSPPRNEMTLALSAGLSSSAKAHERPKPLAADETLQAKLRGAAKVHRPKLKLEFAQFV